jgi:polyferredoxin
MQSMEKAKRKNKIITRFLGATPEQARDTGMAMVLICLLLAYWRGPSPFVPLGIALLLITMVWPRAFQPLAGLWFGFSHVIGLVASKVILSVLFFGLVTPIGLIRRWGGADSLQLKKWKKDRSSVFKVREGEVLPRDLANPY